MLSWPFATIQKNLLENMELETDVTDEMGYIYSGCNGLVFFELLICTRYIQFISKEGANFIGHENF